MKNRSILANYLDLSHPQEGSRVKSGFILMTTMLVLALSTSVVTMIFFKGRLFNTFVPLVLEKERARQLALGGVAVAMAQLSLNDAEFKKTEEKKGAPDEKKDPAKEKDAYAKQLLKTILTVQNRWQLFPLTAEADGIDAQLAIRISCEDGKINLNQLYDFPQKKFVTYPTINGEKVFKALAEAGANIPQCKNLFEVVIELIKKRTYPYVDVTQLIESKKMGEFRDLMSLVAEPPFESEEGKQVDQGERGKVYLTDLFTVETPTYRVNPWVISPSLQLFLKCKSKNIASEESLKKEVDELVGGIPSLDAINLEKDWNKCFKPLYQTDFSSLPKELIPLLGTKFEPLLFSVLCYGKVGRVTQKLLVILERVITEEGVSMTVKKLYWL